MLFAKSLSACVHSFPSPTSYPTDTGRPPGNRRHLLTHTSGLGYEFLSPKLQRYARATGHSSRGTTLFSRCSLPLLFEPGASWSYGTGIDWAGRLVERLADTDLETYFRTRILAPLGARDDITFWPDARAGFADRRVRMTARSESGANRGKVVTAQTAIFGDGITDCLGGGGAYGSMTAFAQVLRSLLADDGKLLGTAAAARMLEPQLSPPARKWLNGLRALPEVWAQFPGRFAPDVELDWGLAGLVTCRRVDGGRGKGTLMWSGLPNLFWVSLFPPDDMALGSCCGCPAGKPVLTDAAQFVDREQDICGIFGTQVLPTGDAKVRELTALFEETMYRRSKAARM